MRAINFEAMVAANRERILALPTEVVPALRWNPQTLSFNYSLHTRTRSVK